MQNIGQYIGWSIVRTIFAPVYSSDHFHPMLVVLSYVFVFAIYHMYDSTCIFCLLGKATWQNQTLLDSTVSLSWVFLELCYLCGELMSMLCCFQIRLVETLVSRPSGMMRNSDDGRKVKALILKCLNHKVRKALECKEHYFCAAPLLIFIYHAAQLCFDGYCFRSRLCRVCREWKNLHEEV